MSGVTACEDEGEWRRRGDFYVLLDELICLINNVDSELMNYMQRLEVWKVWPLANQVIGMHNVLECLSLGPVGLLIQYLHLHIG